MSAAELVDTAPAPDEAAIGHGLDWWFGAVASGQMVASAFGPKLDKRGLHRPFALDDTDGAAQWIANHGRMGNNAYVRMTTVRNDWTGPGRGSKEDTAALPGLWLDVDVLGPAHKSDGLPDHDTALGLIATLPTPSRITHSGGGMYPLWRLDESIELDETNRDTVADLAARFTRAAQRIWGVYHLDAVHDLPRILRPVGAVNLKQDVMAPVAVMGAEGPSYSSLEALVDTIEAIAAEHPDISARTLTPPALDRSTPLPSGTSFADRFHQHNTFADIADVLDLGPWTYEGMDAHRELWLRAGSASGSSVKYDPNAGTVIVWSDPVATELGLVGGRAVSLLEFAAVLTGNTISDLRSDIGREARNRSRGHAAGSVGGKLARFLDGMIDDIANADRAELAPIAESFTEPNGSTQAGATVTMDDDDEVHLHLPEEFWNARESLTKVRRFAYSQGSPADATLGAVLARIAAAIPPGVVVKPNAKPPIALNFAVALIGKSGTGKTTAVKVATGAIQSTVIERDNAPAGSAEGLIESYMGMVDDIYFVAEGKSEKRKVRGQAVRSCLFYVDEGEEFITKAGRDGSTLFTTLRAMVSGNDVGSMNATAERTRHLGAHRYRFVFIAGFQPGRADSILDDADGGTPQRFLWLQATDPNIPYEPDDVHGLDWRARPDNLAGLTPLRYGNAQMGVIDFPEDIGAELYRDAIRRARGDEDLDLGDSHRPVMCVKVAALLCLLENRNVITAEDWDLAQIVVDVSTNVRRHAEAEKRRRAADNERRAAEREGERQVIADNTVTSLRRGRVERVAAVIGRRAHKTPDEHLAVQDFRNALRKEDRHLVAGERLAISYAIDEGWLIPNESGWTAGPEVPPDA